MISPRHSHGLVQTPNGDIAKAIVSRGCALVKSLLGVWAWRYHRLGFGIYVPSVT